MAEPAWTISQRRLEALVLLLLVAASLPAVGTYAVWTASEGPSFDAVWAHAAQPGTSTLAVGLRNTRLWAAWVASTVGTGLPLLLVAAAALRFVSVSTTIRLAAAYQGAAVIALTASAADELATLSRMFAAAFPGGYWLTIVRRWLTEVSPFVLPCAMLTAWSAQRAARHAPGPGAKATALTRAVLLASALLLLAQGAAHLAIQALLVWRDLPTGVSGDVVTQLMDTVLTLAWGGLLLLCALRLGRGQTVSHPWLRGALAANVIGTILVCATNLAWLYLEGAHVLLPPARFVRLCLRTAVDVGAYLPATAVFVWFWWPVLLGRAGVDLRTAGIACAACGYSLEGNVSGRCPECGQPARQNAGP